MTNEITNKNLSERILCTTHKSGLPVVVIPKPGFSKIYAIFATNYGSIDRTFKMDKDSEFVTVPDGIAHFLEHKLFEHEDKNAFDEYAKTGASANAFTSFDKTAYLFSTTDNFKESLKILLDFTANPYFSEESVKKEQGIIGQEITMYDDAPDWRVLFNLLDAIFVNHPVKIDIAGTKESIAKIDKNLLYKCYNTFYNLNNMVLCVCGDITMDEVLKAADEIITKKAEPFTTECEKVNEPKNVNSHYIEQKLSVSRPLFHIGFKENDGEYIGKDGMLRGIVTEVLLEMLAGKGSALYEELYSKGLIGSNLYTEYMTGRSFALSIISGESDNPKEVRDILLRHIENTKKNFDKELFKRCVRVVYGRTMSMFDSVERLAISFISCYFAQMDILSINELFEEVTEEMAVKRLASHFDENTMALSVVSPV